MKWACLPIVASLAICNLTMTDAQIISGEDETDRTTILDDIILKRAESLLIRSILKKLQEMDGDEGFFSQSNWVTKRQHPGKRSTEDLEKRQHPGRREDEEEQYLDVRKRQHPGKREDEEHSIPWFQKRQHPGKRFSWGQISDNPAELINELSKRQHPGKRYLVIHEKRQHPGKRDYEDENSDGDWEATDEENFPEVEKRQHPGKRFGDHPGLEQGTPCDVLDSESCRKPSSLFNFFENISKGYADEKRQHPGKRFALEEEDDLEGNE